MSVDPGIFYRTCRERITALVSDPSVDESMVVPEWTVHDVVAHLSGVSEDATTGNMVGAPGEAWTAAQVQRGRSKTLSELLDQWTRNSPMLEAVFSSPEGAPRLAGVIDVHTHEADLRQAFGLPVEVPSEFLVWVAPRFRGRLGRRTRDEVCAYGWSSDPAPYLEHFFVFGCTDRSLGEV
jgi:uncharacterized protein (TIGR03083 family)